MIHSLHIQNFRGFDNHTIDFAQLSLMVGRNNAGKSTIIEALRLIALAIARHRNAQYRETPRDDFPWIREQMGFWLSTNEIEFNVENLFYRYGEPPAIITATVTPRIFVKIYINQNADLFCTILNDGRFGIGSRPQAAALNLKPLEILPQVTPVQSREEPLGEAYVRRTVSSPLSSSHFRNQLLVYFDRFEEFKRLVEEHWHGVRIRSFDNRAGQLNLLIQDEGFVAEVAWMGHGLQIWLQTMWFLARIDQSASIVLDEPDVYLHADLQRRLIRMLKYQSRQSIIATHSVEMISEVDPESVLLIDRKQPKSVYASSIPAVQKIVGSVGSVHNIHLARLWTGRKLLFVEGDDAGYLRKIQDIVFAESEDPIGAVPQLSIGGWGGWSYVVGSAMLLRNRGGDRIIPYCLLDSDFHLQEDISGRYEEARRNSIQLHIWKRKEIENYFLVPVAIQRLIGARITDGRSAPTVVDVERALESFCNSLKDQFFDKYAEEYIRRKRPTQAIEGNRYARTRIDAVWNSLDAKISLIGGKELISSLSRWSQSEFGVSFNAMNILDHIRGEELDAEIVAVISTIESCTEFQN